MIGRFNGHWTRGGLESAALYATSDEAEQALQALKAEARDRVSKSKKGQWPTEFWWNIDGGLTVVVEVEMVTRLKETSDAGNQPERGLRGDPVADRGHGDGTRDTSSLSSDSCLTPATNE
jgi:hypothetical protein